MTRPPDAPPPPAGSITRWLGGLRGGDAAAAGRLWDRYFANMAELARRRLWGTPTAVADEEDVALSAFGSFCRGVGAGKFPRLADRHDLWSLLTAITAHKAAGLTRRERRLKRGGGSAPAGGAALDGAADPAPPPDLAAQVADECRRLLEALPDPTLREVALLRLEGYTVEEIAARLGCVTRTVERKLLVIRGHWSGGGG